MGIGENSKKLTFLIALIGSLTWIRYSGWFILTYHTFIICNGKKIFPAAIVFQNRSLSHMEMQIANSVHNRVIPWNRATNCIKQPQLICLKVLQRSFIFSFTEQVKIILRLWTVDYLAVFHYTQHFLVVYLGWWWC